MSWLALSDSFEYLCYGSTTDQKILILSVWVVFICQNLKGLSDEHVYSLFYPLTAKLFNLNFHSLEVVSR